MTHHKHSNTEGLIQQYIVALETPTPEIENEKDFFGLICTENAYTECGTGKSERISFALKPDESKRVGICFVEIDHYCNPRQVDENLR